MKGFVLITNLLITGILQGSHKEYYELKYPAVIYNANNVLNLIDFIPFSKTKKVKIYKSNIVAETDIDEKLENDYNNFVESIKAKLANIIIPKKNIIGGANE